MSEMSSWFDPLNAAITEGRIPAEGIGPDDEEAKLLLQMGKLVAEKGPQRFFAMLTAFSFGRALGRLESKDVDISGTEFIRQATEKIRDLA